MTGRFRLARNWIDSSMRAELPVEKHSTVSCFYGDKRQYKKLLQLESYADAHVYLLDEAGYILFEGHGGPDEQTVAELAALI
ncbi:MAG: hypothetical protein AAFN10_02345 [Bacteroidota bacterium]